MIIALQLNKNKSIRLCYILSHIVKYETIVYYNFARYDKRCRKYTNSFIASVYIFLGYKGYQ